MHVTRLTWDVAVLPPLTALCDARSTFVDGLWPIYCSMRFTGLGDVCVVRCRIVLVGLFCQIEGIFCRRLNAVRDRLCPGCSLSNTSSRGFILS